MTGAAPEARMLRRLAFLYGADAAPAILRDVLALAERAAPAGGRGRRSGAAAAPRWSQRDALLITYADSILEAGRPPLAVLRDFLRRRVGPLVSFVHLLPFYTFSSDDGFAVIDYRAVRSDLGGWSDVEALARDYRLAFDGVINHVSAQSAYVKGYLAGDPAFDEFLISLPPDADTSSVLRTRNLPLLHEYTHADGSRRLLWTTFGPDMLDLNYANPRVLLEVLGVLLHYASRGAGIIRLDAIPYLWKSLGTSCAHLKETHEVIKLVRDLLDLTFPDVLLLTETNVPHRENISYFGDGGDEAQMVYNFSLPPLALLAVTAGDASRLTRWASSIAKVSDRATYLNITATHDGIGMRPAEGILSSDERQALLDLAAARGGAVTGKRNADGTLSPYELNLNYFDAVSDPRSGEPLDLQVRRFMLSQAMALAFMGIPGIYIHSLLGSRGDAAAVRESGIWRRVNREKLSLAAVEAELDEPLSRRSRVFSEYSRMLRLRAEEGAFAPDSPQRVLDLGASLFVLERTCPRSGTRILALHNVTAAVVTLDAADAAAGGGSSRCARDILSGATISGKAIRIEPWQVMWLKMQPGC